MQIRANYCEKVPTTQYGNKIYSVEVVAETEGRIEKVEPLATALFVILEAVVAARIAATAAAPVTTPATAPSAPAAPPAQPRPAAQQPRTPAPARPPVAPAPAQEREPGDVKLCPDCGMEIVDCLCEDPFAGEGEPKQNAGTPALPEGVVREVVQYVNATKKDRTPYMTKGRGKAKPKPYHFCKTESGIGFSDFTTFLQPGDTVLLQQNGEYWNVYDPDKGGR